MQCRACHHQPREPGQLQYGRAQLELVPGIHHHGDGQPGVNERPKVHLAEGNDETRVDRQQQQKIQLTTAHQFGEIHAVDQEESLEELLNEVAGSDEQHHLPFRPRPDRVRVQIEHADKSQLQREPKHLHGDPQQEIRFENHFPRD